MGSTLLREREETARREPNTAGDTCRAPTAPGDIEVTELEVNEAGELGSMTRKSPGVLTVVFVPPFSPFFFLSLVSLVEDFDLRRTVPCGKPDITPRAAARAKMSLAACLGSSA